MTKIYLRERESGVQWCSLPLSWSKGFERTLQPEPNTWVRLLEYPSPFCYEQALLLCQESETEWVAWIPDCGEATLNVNQFCLEAD